MPRLILAGVMCFPVWFASEIYLSARAAFRPSKKRLQQTIPTDGKTSAIRIISH